MAEDDLGAVLRSIVILFEDARERGLHDLAFVYGNSAIRLGREVMTEQRRRYQQGI